MPTATAGAYAYAEEHTMKAAVVHAFSDPLKIENRPTPVPGPGQVLVRVEASGLCHTDIDAVLSGEVDARVVFDLR